MAYNQAVREVVNKRSVPYPNLCPKPNPKSNPDNDSSFDPNIDANSNPYLHPPPSPNLGPSQIYTGRMRQREDNASARTMPVFDPKPPQVEMLEKIANSDHELEVARFTAGNTFPDSPAVIPSRSCSSDPGPSPTSAAT